MESEIEVEVEENKCLEPTEASFNDDAFPANLPDPDLPYHSHSMCHSPFVT